MTLKETIEDLRDSDNVFVCRSELAGVAQAVLSELDARLPAMPKEGRVRRFKHKDFLHEPEYWFIGADGKAGYMIGDEIRPSVYDADKLPHVEDIIEITELPAPIAEPEPCGSGPTVEGKTLLDFFPMLSPLPNQPEPPPTAVEFDAGKYVTDELLFAYPGGGGVGGSLSVGAYRAWLTAVVKDIAEAQSATNAEQAETIAKLREILGKGA